MDNIETRLANQARIEKAIAANQEAWVAAGPDAPSEVRKALRTEKRALEAELDECRIPFDEIDSIDANLLSKYYLPSGQPR